ncbi:hypothetical protein [Pantanalinema sp. GBBB05]|uniref:hypothetical protein n=1 Tax=Pantanalinema sp. GBBB05 TaxID=2604139 RepID=UPI001D948785|nr:hypothetical protein [Pantanalinema sp. GBBB05]
MNGVNNLVGQYKSNMLSSNSLAAIGSLDPSDLTIGCHLMQWVEQSADRLPLYWQARVSKLAGRESLAGFAYGRLLRQLQPLLKHNFSF